MYLFKDANKINQRYDTSLGFFNKKEEIRKNKKKGNLNL